ncbi:hypothetical protein [Klebsiella pneumoniae]|uniref:hypothetical protein n=1 Tax=Klebsiella pneumoniae TaxID=573 RepID=UPI001D196A5D|nr:hypothetical protein [Klebsiella pneumoniae]
MEDGKTLPQMPPLEARLGLSPKVVMEQYWLVRLVSSQHRVAINEGNVVAKILTAALWFCRGFRQCRLLREQVI